MSKEELTLPAEHLRACDISDKSEDLCMDQHANAFSETLPKPVATDIGPLLQPVKEDIEPGIRPGTMTETYEGPGTRPGTATETGTESTSDAGRQSRLVKVNKPKRPVLSGKALKDWIIDRGFDGVSTQLQRDRPKSKIKESKDPIRSSYEVRKK